MSNIIADDACGTQVKNDSTLYKGQNQNNYKYMKAPNTMPTALPVDTPTGKPMFQNQNQTQSYQSQYMNKANYVDPNMYGPQKELNAQMQQRYAQIKSGNSGYIPFVSSKSNYAAYN